MVIGIIARLKIQAGKNAEFEAMFIKLQEAVRVNEPGCNFYGLHHSEYPQTYVVLEQYQDEAAVNAPQASDHFRTIVRPWVPVWLLDLISKGWRRFNLS